MSQQYNIKPYQQSRQINDNQQNITIVSTNVPNIHQHTAIQLQM